MGATDRWDLDAIENETAWQDHERAVEEATAQAHAPTRAELEDVFRPLAPSPTKERDRRVAALTRILATVNAETIIAQRAARVLTRSATRDPGYEEPARCARERAVTLVRYRDALRQQLTALTNGGST